MHNPNENHIGLLCTDGSWAVNDTGIYYPAGGLPYDNESIQSSDSGRTEDGTMHIDWVAGKVKIFMKWARLTGHEVKHIKNLIFMKEFDFHFVDLGDRMTARCYVSKMSYEKLSEDDGYAAEGGVYENISANFIEI